MLKVFHNLIFIIAIGYSIYFIANNFHIFNDNLTNTNFFLFFISMIILKLALSLNLYFVAEKKTKLSLIFIGMTLLTFQKFHKQTQH